MTFWLFIYFYKMKIREWLIHHTHIYIVLCFKCRYVSCTLGCPYEGSITPQKVTEVRDGSGFLVHGEMLYIIFIGLFSLLFSASVQ